MALFAFGLGLLYFVEWAVIRGGVRHYPGAVIFLLVLVVISLFLITVSHAETPVLALVRGVLSFVNGLALVLTTLFLTYRAILEDRLDAVDLVLAVANTGIGLYILFTGLQQIGAFGPDETATQ